MLGPTLEMWNASTSVSRTVRCSIRARSKRSNSCGSEEQKQTYIPHLVSGEWTGTMCLTEPQAGSDLAAVRTKAVPEGDHYRDQRPEDFHHVRRARHGPEYHSPRARALARRAAKARRASRCSSCRRSSSTPTARSASATTSSAPASSTSSASTRNPTCTLNYGEKAAAPSVISSAKPNRGLEYMFIMMNAARFSVGVQGIGDRRSRLSERARIRQGARPEPRRRHARSARRSRSSIIPTCAAC